MRKISNWFRRHAVLISIVGVILLISSVVPLPYYIYQPGSAESVANRVTVVGGHKDEKGSLMLTTVYSTPVYNIYYWLYGKFGHDTELLPKKEVDGGIPNSDYSKLLKWMMDDSQTNAEVAAMKYLGKPVQVVHDGVEIGTFTANSQAANDLHSGDIIVAVDEKPVKTLTDLQGILATKKEGDRVVISALHDGKSFQVPVPVILIPANGQIPAHPGIGFSPLQVTTATVPEKIEFHTGDIGGPSAGMMFSLEIISQLSTGDLTKGYQIAGTGTISLDGVVGQIGGIEHKIVAATRSHAEIFFVPKDVKQSDTNEKLALTEAARIHSPLKIVPVAHLSDAVDYLKSLPPHSK